MHTLTLLFFLVFTSSAWSVSPYQEFGCTHLPDQRVGCSAPHQTQGNFHCSLYGNFSLDEFKALFMSRGSGYVLRAKASEFKIVSETKNIIQPCLEFDDVDSAPPRCLKYDQNRYEFTKKHSVSRLSGAAVLHLECNDYSLGRRQL